VVVFRTRRGHRQFLTTKTVPPPTRRRFGGGRLKLNPPRRGPSLTKMDAYGNASETNRSTDAGRLEHGSGRGLGTHLAERRGGPGKADRAVRQEIRISPEGLSKGNLRHLRQMVAGEEHLGP